MTQGAKIWTPLSFFSARRANFFSAVGKILDLVSVFRDAKKWAQNRNWNEILPCIENIARWMSKKGGMEWSETYENIRYVDSCYKHWYKAALISWNWNCSWHKLFREFFTSKFSEQQPLRIISLHSLAFTNIEGGPLFCAPIKFQDYYQYANK